MGDAMHARTERLSRHTREHAHDASAWLQYTLHQQDLLLMSGAMQFRSRFAFRPLQAALKSTLSDYSSCHMPRSCQAWDGCCMRCRSADAELCGCRWPRASSKSGRKAAVSAADSNVTHATVRRAACSFGVPRYSRPQGMRPVSHVYLFSASTVTKMCDGSQDWLYCECTPSYASLFQYGRIPC